MDYEKIKIGRSNDLTNKKFGRLTALYRTNNIGNKVAWCCQCECGNKIAVMATNLTTNKTKSCGCLNDELKRSRFKDITNKRFGKLVALEPTDKRTSNNNIIWKCQCDCGNLTEKGSHELLQGKTKSCGCLIEDKIIDLKGQKFGKLTAKEHLHKNNKVYWLCECECGNIVEVNGDSLRRGVTQSCGCLKSKGEITIIELLKGANIQFDYQKTFDNCRFENTQALAYFDFYVNNKYLIEYDGEQHFKWVKNATAWNNEERFIKTKERDKYKNQWCKDNNIPLIRIPYTHLKDLCIEDLLLETSNYIIK